MHPSITNTEGVKWDLLETKRVKPPYIPPVSAASLKPQATLARVGLGGGGRGGHGYG